MQLQFESDMDIAVRAYRKALSELTEAERKRDSIIAGMKTEAGSYKGFRDSLVDKLKAIEQQRGHEISAIGFFHPIGPGNNIHALDQPPEPPPFKQYDELQPGDVLLVNKEGIAGYAIWAADTISSATGSPASHTVLFLKEVNGVKLFLDNTSGLQTGEAAGVGPHIITGETFLRLYGHRGAGVAELASPDFDVAQPLSHSQAQKLWDVASGVARKELADERQKEGNLIDKTDYGFWGDDMVCSDASRWALVKSTGRSIPPSRSPLKKLLNISFGPANFFGDRQDFIITPLKMPGDDS